MKGWSLIGMVCLLVFAAGCNSPGGQEVVEESLNLADVEGLVRQAAAYADSAGQEAALAEFMKKDGRFSQGALYVYAYDYNGTLLAHPCSPGFVGTDQANGTDVRGLPVNRIGAYTAESGGGFMTYLYPAPEGGAFDAKAPDAAVPRIGYVAPAGETWWIGSGIYLSDLVGDRSSCPVAAMINLVERGAAYGREHGTEAAFAEIGDQSGKFVDADGHYIYAYDYNGTLLAHPYLPEKVGTNLIAKQGPFGMEMIRALAETAESGGGFVVFVWPNPDQEDREELKIGYVLPVDDTWWVGSGVYLSEITGTDASLPSPTS
ncbi:calcium:proton antiporter [Methanoculleus sp. FWC-SCC1]|uniref:Calcium:proton antiporter n=1 Tax=Methanoculleus frigidifontis TaxID=2584085 RepID=A0ABT8MDP5_9EURY|nr:cache domain-containing protein [Methanoculleus sp. FWC-SCC1]MDN7026059.1 calcium:proton antiporter [Methanoculleus sp. FWC-SCC1]